MPIILKEQSEVQISPGTYIARCFRIVDAGTQPSEMYGEKRKLIISWELPTERIQLDGVDMPLSIGRIYSFSLNSKANLRKDLEAWRGRPFTKDELAGFELAKVLGTACQVNVTLNDKGKAVVSGIVGVPKGIQVPEMHNPKLEYSFEEGKNAAFATLPEWIQKFVSGCVEWTTPHPTEPHVPEPNEEDEDVPF
jgi:hypothetical protein